MLALLITFGAIVYLTAYFAIGWALAKRDLPHLWARARKEWSSDSLARGDVKSGTIATLFFWPVRLPFIKALNIVDRLDPRQMQEEIDRRDREIRDLERQLRIGGDR